MTSLAEHAPELWGPLKRQVPEQQRLWASTARLIIIHSGRRSGKSLIGAKRRAIRAALRSRRPKWRGWFCAPTRPQAKRIYWEDLKAMIPPDMRLGKPSESELTITLVNGAQLGVAGMDEPARIEGDPIDFIALDELDNMKPQTWELHVRPGLDTPDRPGEAVFLGVPEGQAVLYELVKTAKRRLSQGDSEWDVFHWPSAAVLPPEVIEKARRDLDPLTFAQEYGGEFVAYSGRAYYCFAEEVHAAEPVAQCYDPAQPLDLWFDFNVSPGVVGASQELYYRGRNPKVPKTEPVTHGIGEVYIPSGSNTRIVMDEAVRRWRAHRGPVRAFGDASGGNDGTAKLQGSDWDIIARIGKAAWGDRFELCVPADNPPVRSSINSVNSRLQATDGTVRCLFDPVAQQHTCEDLALTKTLAGTNGEIDKRDKRRTHLTDAFRYRVWADWPQDEGEGTLEEQQL